MTLPLLKKVEDAINSNIKNNSVTYFDGKKWATIKYCVLKDSINKIHGIFIKKPANTAKYILLFLKVTLTFPAIVLGTLRSGHGFICIESEDKLSILQHITKLKIKYILSNLNRRMLIDLDLPKRLVFEEKIELLGEDISIWNTDLQYDEIEEIPFIYAIRTSGSTGISKLIQVPHDSLFPNINDLSNLLQVCPQDVMFLMSPVTFDPCMVELFLALANGATLCILDKSVKGDPISLIDAICPQESGLVTILQITPSLLRRWSPSLLRNRIFSKDSSLRTVILGGEEFPSIGEVKSWEVPECINIFNIYGITEVSCWASINQVWPTKKLDIHIGEPLLETSFQINLDEMDEGELYIGSNSRICLINDELSKDVYSGHEVYRATGDIFKKVNEKLYFIGRKDDTLKRWGVSFSLSDIEKIARNYENTESCSCLSNYINNTLRIVLFIVQKDVSDTKDFKKFLRKYLPKASWPDSIITIERLPLSKHGKVCKNSLKKLVSVERRTSTRQTFNELWQHYTNEDACSSKDFISAGGDSLTALQFVSELNLIFSDLPDIILGLLLQTKSNEEIWATINNCHNNEASAFKNQLDKELSDISIHIVNVLKTCLKGRAKFLTDRLNCAEEHFTGHLELEENWKFNMGKCVDGSPLGVQYISGKSITVVGSHSGRVAVLDVISGDIISQCTLPGRVEASACISLCGKFYFIGCYDCCLYCIQIDSGDILWKYKTKDIVKSTCAYNDGHLIFGSYDKHLYNLNLDGSCKWKILLRSPIQTEVLIQNDRVYCATLNSIAAINEKTGQLIWEVQQSPIFSNPVIHRDCLVVADVKGIIQWLNTDDGKEQTSFKANDMVFSSLTTFNILNEEGIIFGCQDGFVYCLKERQLYWKTPLKCRIIATPFVVSSNEEFPFIICSTTEGTIYLLKLHNGEEILHYSLPGEVFSSPIFLSKCIVIGCRDDNIYCLKIKHL